MPLSRESLVKLLRDCQGRFFGDKGMEDRVRQAANEIEKDDAYEKFGGVSPTLRGTPKPTPKKLERLLLGWPIEDAEVTRIQKTLNILIDDYNARAGGADE